MGSSGNPGFRILVRGLPSMSWNSIPYQGAYPGAYPHEIQKKNNFFTYIYTAHTPGAYPKTNNPTVLGASGSGRGPVEFFVPGAYPAHTQK